MSLVLGLCTGADARCRPKRRLPDAKTPAGVEQRRGRRASKRSKTDWVAAVKAKDAAKLSEILADSWVGLGWDGKITDKATEPGGIEIPRQSA